MRRIYLDNIRWVTVLIVMMYHVFYIFNSVGVLGGIGSFSEVQHQDAIMSFVYPWFMILLFVVAGMSAEYALEKKPIKDFIKSRTTKLLVPSTLGLFAFHWITGFFNIKIGGGLEYIPKPLIYPISALSGTGHLWFAQTLWIYSLLIALFKKIDKNGKIISLGKKCNTVIVILFLFLIWGSAQILNMPVITVYRFGIYFMAFLIGFYVLSDDEIQDKIEKIHIFLLPIALIMGLVYTYMLHGKDFTQPEILQSLFTNAYAWIAVLTIIGSFKAWFNRENRFTRYMTRSSFGLYVLHYVVILIPGYYLKESGMPTALVYICVLIIVYTVTPILYEVIRRIPVYRYFVLGIKKNNIKKGISDAEAQA